MYYKNENAVQYEEVLRNLYFIDDFLLVVRNSNHNIL